MVRPAGFEPATYGFVVRHSIQLSYGRTGKKILRKTISDFRHADNYPCYSMEALVKQKMLPLVSPSRGSTPGSNIKTL